MNYLYGGWNSVNFVEFFPPIKILIFYLGGKYMKISIASGKGGTGKTTIAVNLAIFLKEKYPEMSIYLIDLDVEAPNSEYFIKPQHIKEQTAYRMIPEVTENCNHCGKCSEICEFNAIVNLPDNLLILPELCKACYACIELCPLNALKEKFVPLGTISHGDFFTKGKSDKFTSSEDEHKIKFTEGRLKIGEAMAVPLIRQVKYQCTEKNNYNKNAIYIFDAPPGTSCPVIEATKNADLVILVTEPTPFGLHDLKLSVETMKQLSKNYAVVINRYEDRNHLIEKYCQEQDIPILAKIPNLRKAAESYSQGKVLIDEIPEIKEKIRELVNNLFGILETI